MIPPDARIGVVFSGGGARGLAHVGVIRVLEAQGIKPDIITGTSMGSIVGALYASGRSADEIDRIAREMDWRDALSDASPRSHQPYPFRQLEAGMNTDLRMSITSDGIAFPRGVIEGQHLEQLLGTMFEEKGLAQQFSALPIRFAAVAADLETGQAVILDKGDVASAVRASMSIPGAIAPVERDGRLLVDGGIANNMPVDLARQMGATFIIAVDVSAPLLLRDQIVSIFDVANQTTAFLVRLNTLEQTKNLHPNDVLLVPQLEEYGSAAFDQADGIIEAGYQAAVQVFSQAETTSTAAPSEAELPKPPSLPIIRFIRVKNDSPISDKVIRTLIEQPLDQPLDRPLLESNISRLYGLDYFSVVRYRIIEENGESGLEMNCVARETGNSWLKLGLELADAFEGNSQFGLSASLRSAGLNAYGGTAFSRVQLGTTPELEFRFLQPLDAGLRYFIEPAAGYKAEIIELYDESYQQQPFARYQNNSRWASLSLGRLLWQEVAEIRAGVTRERSQLDFRSGIDLISDQKDQYSDDGYYFVSLGWDSLDDLGFPSEGARWSLAQELHKSDVGAASSSNRYVADMTLATTLGHSTLLIEGDAQIGDNDTNDFNDIPFIGGFLELSGLPPRSRFGRHRALVRSVFYQRLDEDGPLPFGVPVYLGFSVEKGNVWFFKDDISWSSTITAGSIFLGARTPLGPAYLSYGLTDEGDRSLAIFLGQRFR